MKKITFYFATLLVLFSCSNADDNNSDNSTTGYENGYLIVNEGNFQSSNASISYLSNDLATFEEDIFSANNEGALLGDVAQSTALYNNLVFIAVNNSNVIKIADRYTFKEKAEITDQIQQPRYMAFGNEKLFVSNALNNTITVYDANDYTFLHSISLSYTPEKIAVADSYLYVQSVSYATENTVSVISLDDYSIVKNISFEEPMNGMVTDNNLVKVVSSGSEKSVFTQINGTEISREIVTNIQNARNLSKDGDYIYFTAGSGVYRTEVNLQSISESPLFSVADNGYSTFYGFNVIDNKIFTSDAKNFTEDSVVSIYSTEGVLLKEIQTGFGTNGFYKN